jgi:hypothetical protein
MIVYRKDRTPGKSVPGCGSEDPTSLGASNVETAGFNKVPLLSVMAPPF